MGSSYFLRRLLLIIPTFIGITLLVFAVLVFARLGNYGLWDDEAQTALFGQAVKYTAKAF